MVHAEALPRPIKFCCDTLLFSPYPASRGKWGWVTYGWAWGEVGYSKIDKGKRGRESEREGGRVRERESERE